MAKFSRCFSLIFLGIMTACGGAGNSGTTSNGGGSHGSVVLQSIQISANTSFPAGLSQQITATGTYSDSTVKDVTSSAAWTSSNPNVATIDGKGMAKAMAPGPVLITATVSNVSKQVSLTVTPPTLMSIAVASASPTVAAGLTDQFTATGSYSDGSTQNLSSTASWSVSSSAVAAVSNSGLVTAKSNGSAVVTAAVGGVSGTGSLTVGAALLVSIGVIPATASVSVGSTDQCTATGTYTDGSTHDITHSVAWSISNAALGSISSSGLMTAQSNGSTVITATSGSITGSAPLTITIALVSLKVSPSSPTIASGTAVQFKATGTFTDGTTQDLTGTADWSSSLTSNATISNSAPTKGLATAIHPASSSVITASVGSIVGSTTINISSASLSSIAVTPANTSIPLGLVQQFTAKGTFNDGTVQDITNTVAWTSSQLNNASITVSGAATARNVGTTSISAGSGAITGSTSLTVNLSNMVSVSIQPAGMTLAQGTSGKLNAIGLFNDGSTRDVSAQAAWTSSNPTAATAQPFGKVQSVNPGLSTVITAAVGPLTTSANVTVTAATITSISVTPTVSSVAAGTQVTYAATGLFSDNSSQVITGNVTWSCSDNTVTTISNNPHGIATTIGAGTASITASFSYGGASATGQAPLTVTGANLVGIQVNPASAVLAPASTQLLSATATYDDGTTQNVTQVVSWNTSSASLATVTSYGQVTGQSAGLATITATFGAFSGSANVLVESAALTSITVTPPASTIPQQIMSGFTALGSFSDGSSQDLTGAVTWTSSHASVATVSNGAGTRGYVTAIAPGASTISAVFAGQVGTTAVTVTNATLISLNITPTNPSIVLGKGQTFVATATFSDNTTANVTNQATWSSSDVTIAIINAQGQVTSVSSGTTTITGTLNGVSNTAILTVN